jgi:hypothetical protein
MKNERLLLPATSNEQFIDSVIGTLCLTEGVQTASRVVNSVEVSVTFDEAVTSTDVMRATLRLAGYNIEPPKAAKSSCCGACGG